MSKTPVPSYGVYTPVVTYFNEDESVDYATVAQHINRLLDSGVKGLVIHGSNGEATHLTHGERSQLIAHARSIISRRGATHA